MIDECIILTGKTDSEIPEKTAGPSPELTVINGKPFLWWVVRSFLQRGIENFIFTMGIEDKEMLHYLQSAESPFTGTMGSYQTVELSEPVGTGGTILKALERSWTKDILVADSKTLFVTDLKELIDFHYRKESTSTISLMEDPKGEHPGHLILDKDNKIYPVSDATAHTHIQYVRSRLYVIHIPFFKQNTWPEKFSFTDDYIQKEYDDGNIFGLAQKGIYLDARTPETRDRLSAQLPQLSIH